VKVQLPHVDVMVCTSCELRCVGCTNFIGVLPMQVWDYDLVVQDIENAAKAMHAEVACILGGEPLGHPRLVDLIRATKRSGLGDRVRVLTNGIRLHKMKPEFWVELEDLKISIYPGETPQSNIDLAVRMQAEHGFALEYKHVEADPFRAVLTPARRSDESAQATYDGCWYRTFTRKIEQGHFYRCCTSPQISQTVLGLPPDHDGIPLNGLTGERLQEFLDRPTFMESCTRCHGNMGPVLREWREERDKTKWLEVSAA
jgi:cyclic pyranopterin phosphate synthase